MRSKLQQVSMAACLVFSMIGMTSVNASFRPTFSLDECSWNATHIALVRTTSKDAVFSVVESWKGDLHPGDSIELPELKPRQNAVPISSYPKPTGPDRQSEEIPRQPIGSQMVLFLKKQEGAGPATRVEWQPASAWGGMKVSVLWIDGGKVFCFQQLENPGPSALSQCIWYPVRSSDVAVFTARIQQVLHTQRDLAFALAMKNVNARAERLGRIALGDIYVAQKEAIDTLGKAGSVALPEILQVLDKPPGFYNGDFLIRALVDASGKDSAMQLHARLEQDVIYWKTIGPTLTQDWQDQLVVVGSPLFVKFNETSLLIRELDREHYPPAVQTVEALRDFWVSQPQLYDSKLGHGLPEQCDAFLKNTERKN